MFPQSEEAFFLIPDEIVERVLVVGGGVAGMQAALDVAEAGMEVVLVEREPSLGGRAAQLEAMFPTLDHSVCALREKMLELIAHPRIKVYTYSEIESLGGFGGDFGAVIRKKARKVTDHCNGCGLCWRKCPAEGMSEFDFGMGTRAAIYLPFPQAVPAIPTLDPQRCLHLYQGCDICQAACPVDAIDFDQQDELLTERVGAVIMATGFAPQDVTGLAESATERHADVITGAQLERLLSGAGPTRGEVRRPSDGKRPKSVVFVSCPSLDRSDGQPYCSRVCCANAAKQAVILGKLYGDIKLSVVYSEIRTTDRGSEALIQRAKEEYGTEYVRGRALGIDRDGEEMVVFGEYLDDGGHWEIKADLVVLAAGIRPNDGFEELAERLGVIGDEHNFVLQPAPKLQPLETTVPGVFVAGTATGPLDITESALQGSGAALRAMAFVRKLSRQAGEL